MARASEYQMKLVNESTRPPSEREWDALVGRKGFIAGAESERAATVELLREVRDAMRLTIDRADDFADSFISRPVRDAFPRIDAFLGEKGKGSDG